MHHHFQNFLYICCHLFSRLIEAIDDLAAQGVIAPVTTPTKWISSIVAASKKNVLNPKHLSHTIQGENYQLPIVEDIATASM